MIKKNKLPFGSDYMEGAYPLILSKLMETNMEKTSGYGLDDYSLSAKQKIRKACDAPDADVFFLTGGTQTNMTVIDSLLCSYQGVISAQTGHIVTHEAGAVEFCGHKIISLPQKDGKLSAIEIEKCVLKYREDENRSHTVMPGMVYLSHPTELGTLYSLNELEQISLICRKNNLYLYLDGARLAYALACPVNNVSLADLARLCDVFYIGGTKCGALFGEAVVIPKHNLIPHFFTIIKQHGALLAKGRINAIQFDVLFNDNLYFRLGCPAIEAAQRIRNALIENGYKLAFQTYSNQIFVVLDKKEMDKLSDKVEMAFWENTDETHVVMRLTTSWSTQKKDVDNLIELIEELRK